MAFAWTNDLETGNQAIDNQHKQLFKALNDLLAACAKGQGRNEMQKTALFLLDYTKKHFADEEKLQISVKYPEYQKHKGYHEAFKKVAADLVAELQKEGPTTVMLGKINSKVGDWLVTHIKREDKKLAAYIREHA